MVLILLSWVYAFFTSVTIGIGLGRLFKVKTADFVNYSFLGLFFTTILASTWALYSGINVYFFLFLLALNLILARQNKAAIIAVIQTAIQELKRFPNSIKVILGINTILILYQCAKGPAIIDNESYYIQTIKWLNEYGFVRGLGNLHLFLGQTSGWHITQSVFNLSFLYDRFNDINGYCLVLFTFFGLQKLNLYLKNNNKIDLLFGILPLGNLFFFQFISAPSPDLPVYLLSFMVFSMYLKQEYVFDREAFSIFTLLILFAVYIKMTAVTLLILPIILVLKHFQLLKKRMLPIGIISLIMLVLYIVKNVILTGYPLFPLTLFRFDGLDYAIPKEILTYFSSGAMRNEFFISMEDFNHFSTIQILLKYFIHNGIDGIMALITLLILFFIPFILHLKKESGNYWPIYASFLLLVPIVVFTSPQLRFYIHFTLFFLLVLLSFWIKSKKNIMMLFTLSTVVLVLFSFRNSVISVIAFPLPNSNLPGRYINQEKGNLKYHSPAGNSFFWATGNGELPCVNTAQLNYFESYFYYMPQQRSAKLKDGFYAKKVIPNE